MSEFKDIFFQTICISIGIIPYNLCEMNVETGKLDVVETGPRGVQVEEKGKFYLRRIYLPSTL